MSAAAVVEREAELKEQALSLVDRAKLIVITDQRSFEAAGEFAMGVVAMRKQIGDHHAPIKKAAHDAHRAVCDAEANLLRPVTEAEQIVKREIGRYEIEQRRLQAERERQAREEAEQLAAEQIEEAAVEAESQGASVEEVAAIISRPLMVPRVAVEPTIQRVTGVATSVLWKAQVTSLRDLCRAIADGKVPEAYVAPNMTALNARARADKSGLSVPGVRAVSESNVRIGGR